MKGISKNDRGYLNIFLIILLFAILSGCNGTNPVINSFFASPSTIIAGDSATLSWTVNDADSVTIDYGIGTVALTGITTVNPTTDTTYTLIATNSTGPVIATVTVTVTPIETLTIQPGSEGKDAYVKEAYPNDVVGDGSSLAAGHSSVNLKYRTYLQFNINSSLPADAVIIHGNLMLFQNYSSGTFDTGAYKVTSNWEESSITWNNQPNSSSEVEGAAYININKNYTWSTWEIDDLVKGWWNGSISNNGILVKAVDESSNSKYVYFNSSDDIADVTKHPKLVITYYVP